VEPQRAHLAKRDLFFQAASFSAFFLDAEDAAGLSAYLARQGRLESGESVVSVRMAGQGNMNYLVRVATSVRTFILKQSRPWVEKYPQISAPFDRALVEARFYGLLRGSPAAEFLPKLYWVDEESRILCLEDLGGLGDGSDIYGGRALRRGEVEQLVRFLSLLHEMRDALPNREMRQLNHYHIFVYPFQLGNGLALDDITPGFERVADRVKKMDRVQRRAQELGQLYLSDGDYLLHGDFFPGSWLRTADGLKVIDPEFGFTGPREFDVGVFLAHLRIAGAALEDSIFETRYAQWEKLDRSLVSAFSGVEILRRLLGVAQLPISFDLERKRSLVEEALEELLA
jgi:5-methylthioribose kinase